MTISRRSKMANNSQNYKNFCWYDQTIDERLIQCVRVRIFNALDTITCDGYQQLVATDGNHFTKSSRGFKSYVTGYSYAILSSGIFRRTHIHSGDTFNLFIKLYVTNDFQVSMLDNLEFLGKSYLMEALSGIKMDWKQTVKPEKSFSDYLKKKAGANSGKLYQLLKVCAHNSEHDKIEQFFKDYEISEKYQVIFWKELYIEAVKNRK